MENNKTTGLQKYHFWLLFFFLIFGFTFAMIIWTIKNASSVPVFEDKSFMQSYHDVDNNFNTMMIANHKFNTLYDTTVSINETTVGLEMNDIFFGQRSLEKSKNRDMLHQGSNTFDIKIIDKQSVQVVENAKIHLEIVRAIDNKHDMELENIPFSNGSYQTTVNLEAVGNWNITGFIEVGENKGYLFIKTNTKK